MSTLQRGAELVGTGGGTVAVLLGGLFLGADVWSVSVTIGLLTVQIVFLEGLMTVLGFTAFAVASGLVLVRGVWFDGRSRTDVTDGPPVRAIVPAYQDADVVGISVRSLLDSEYESLSISIVVEPDDRPTLERAREFAAAHEAVECLVNGQPGSKATAINHAVRDAEADYVAVFDADERVAPEFVPAAMATLLDGADVYQGRRIPRPTGGVEALAYCERVVVHAAYALFEAAGFANPRSAATAFTREAFETTGGYDDALTEDIAFSHACHDADLTVVTDRGCTNTMEAPHTLRDLWGQRKRWRIGQLEVLHTRVRSLELTSPLAIVRASGSVVGGVLTLVIASHVLLLGLLEATTMLAIPFCCVLATVGAVWLRDASAGRIGRPTPSMLAVPLVYPALGVLTVKSMLEYALTWDGEWYQVTKTGA